MNLQIKKPTSINKILVVGHPLSGYEALQSLLNSWGMQAANPSKRDGFLPSDISSILLKAHRIDSLDPLRHNVKFEQIDAGPVWHSLALDLLIGNIDHELWGWSDPQAIYLLDYWKSLDPQLAFILVYDTPQDLIARAFEGPTSLTPDALEAAIDNWGAYNDSLLRFYHRNTERCLLVHAQQIRNNANDYFQKVRTLIGAPISNDVMDTEADIINKQAGTAVSADGDLPINPEDAASETKEAQVISSQGHAMRVFIAQTILQQHPATLEIYEELQSIANVPLDKQTTHSLLAFDAWSALASIQERYKQQTQALVQELHQLQEELEKSCQDAQQQIEPLRQAKVALEQANSALAAKTAATVINPELEKENELLLLQLHQVQEELERYYLENQQLKQNSKPILPAKPRYIGAADRVKRQLSYRLGAEMISRSRSLGGWLGMPMALIRVAREYRREAPQREAKKLPPIAQYADAHDAERVKQHLSYRLGAAMIANSRTLPGWLKLPWALRHEMLDFKRSQVKK